MSALVERMRAGRPGFGSVQEDWSAWFDRKYEDDMLRADVEEGAYGVQTHPNQAAELLKLPTEALRRRAMAEAQTRVNLQGGVLSGVLFSVVDDLLAAVAADRDGEELYGERTARVYREREAALRASTGDRSAIYYPSEFATR